MAEDQKSLKFFLHEAKMRADAILALDHINNEAKVAIKDLLQISQNYERLMSSNVGTSADTSLLKKRYEQSKGDIRKVEDQVTAVKGILFSLVPEIVAVSAEANSLLKITSSDPENPIFKSITKIKQSLTKMAESIAQSQK